MSSSPAFDLRETALPGCMLLRPRVHRDARGMLVKTFHRADFSALGLPTSWAEDFFSLSGPAVLRGLHFQRPPHAHSKLVTCVRGRVLDVLVDLRLGSPAYGHHETLVLDSAEPAALLVAAGVAHGFQVLGEEALMAYKTTTAHVPESDDGILWSSCGIEWPLEPSLSSRDAAFPGLAAYFERPCFRYRGTRPARTARRGISGDV